jgi:glycosyltransferase involved in cell wall biosynthesis
LLVDSDRNHKSWLQYIKKLVQNPEIIEVLGSNLNKMVTERYSIDVITEKRKIYYEKLVQEQKK